MKKFLLPAGLAALAIASPLAMQAAPVSPEAALSAAIGDHARKARGAKTLNAANYNLRLTLNKPEKATEAAVYLFGADNGGFIIAAADDAVAPLLAYSSEGNINDREIPANLKWWLDGYAAQIAYATANGAKPVDSAIVPTAAEERPSIAPMVKTKWDQGDPYNMLCPTVSGQRCVTGCVATALSQLMKFFEWPTNGSGSVYYNAGYGSNNLYLDVDFSQSYYQWSSMRNTYSSSSSQTSKQAVARIMADAGAASLMTYSPTGSGASTCDAGIALIKNFNYDKGLRWENRYFYTDDEWTQLVYNELAQGHPIYYDGTDGQAGHAFVCDGYDASTGFFSFNWGWSGYYDGYFSLNVMLPEGQGTGGGSGQVGYVYDQAIFSGMQRPAGTEIIDANLAMFNYDYGTINSADFETSATSYNRNSNVSVNFKEQTVCCFGLADTNYADYGVICIDKNGKVVAALKYNDIDLQVWDAFYYAPSFAATKFPVGEYDVYAAYRTQGASEWSRMRNYGGYSNRVHMVVTDSKITVNKNYFDPSAEEEPAEPVTLTAEYKGSTPVEAAADDDPATYYSGNTYEFAFDVTSTGATEADIFTMICDSEGRSLVDDALTLSFTEASTLPLSATISLKGVPAGEYDLWVGYLNDNDEIIQLGAWSITVEAKAAEPSVTMFDAQFNAITPAIEADGDKFITNHIYTVNVTLTPEQPGYSEFFLGALDSNGFYQISDWQTVEFPIIDPVTLSIPVTMPSNAGNYEIVFITISGENYEFASYSSYDMTIEEPAVADPYIEAAIAVTNLDGNETNELIIGADYTLAAYTQNVGAASEYELSASVLGQDSEGYYFIGDAVYNSYAYDANEERMLEIPFHISDEIEPGTYYVALLNKVGIYNYIIEIVEVNVVAGGVSAIDNLAVERDAKAEYFTLQGVRVARPSASGIYLRRVGSKTSKVVFSE